MVRLVKKEGAETKNVSKGVIKKIEKTTKKVPNTLNKKEKKVLSKNFIPLPDVDDIVKEEIPKRLVSKAFQPKSKLNKKTVKSKIVEKKADSKLTIRELERTAKNSNVTNNKQKKLSVNAAEAVSGKTVTNGVSNGSQSKSLSNKTMAKANGVEKKDNLKGVVKKIEKTKNKSSNVLNKKQEKLLSKSIKSLQDADKTNKAATSLIAKGPEPKSVSNKKIVKAKDVEKKDTTKPIIKKIEIVDNKMTNVLKKKQKKLAPKNVTPVSNADEVVKEETKDKTTEETKSDGPMNKKVLLKCVQALLKVSSSTEEQKKNLFQDEASKIHLQIVSIKVPKVSLHQHRISLPHSLVTSTDDVALFVADLNRGRNRNCQESIDHAQDFLKAQGVERPITVYSINQIKTEYRVFEMRRRLVNSHDHFLVDGRIAGHMSHLLGKHFRIKRKCPVPIHFGKSLKEEINRALHKTNLQIHGVGDSSTVEIGHTKMSPKQIIQNILAVADDLTKHFPGGWENIRALRIKTPLSLSIPIYMSLKNKNDVPVPVIEPKRPKNYKEVEGELSTYKSNAKVLVTPDGTCMVLKKEKNKEKANKGEADNDEKESADKLEEENDSDDFDKDGESKDLDSDDSDESDEDDEDDEDDESEDNDSDDSDE